jgi:outer membrane protein
MRRSSRVLLLVMASAFGARFCQAGPAYSVDEAVALARKQNPEILMAAKQLEAARGGVLEARAGFLPGVVSNGLVRKRERQEPSRLRSDDYDVSLQVVQNLYTGGAISSQLAIARLIEEKRSLEYQALVNRVSMDVRLAFFDVLLNRAQIRVREQSVRVFEEELKTQRERFETGTVGSLNVSRAEVALANEQPELIDAQTRLQNSELRLAQLIGVDASGKPISNIQAAGQLQYAPKHPDLNECLAYADVTRPEIRARQIDVEIETQQLTLDRSATRPRVEAFAGYEVYSERDPDVGPEFNHGFVVGLNATWHIFDGHATEPLTPGARLLSTPWKPQNSRSPPMCGARFSTSNRLSASFNPRPGTCRTPMNRSKSLRETWRRASVRSSIFFKLLPTLPAPARHGSGRSIFTM